VREKLRDPAVTLLVAEEADELVGFTACGASRDEDGEADTGEIRTFFVSPGSWRRGVGRALMQAALEDLRRRGYERCTVWSFAANRQANSFYEALGFTPDGGERTEAAWAHILEVRYARGLS
jgi:GNAT superfamily N-acetyltransferase